MSKFFRLCSCEFTKIMKKVSTKVMLIVLVISLFASAGITALTEKVKNLEEDYNINSDYKEEIRSSIESLKGELENDNLDQATKNELQASIDANQIALDNDVNINQLFWKTELITSNIQTDMENFYNLKLLGDNESADKVQSLIDKKINLLKNDDFNGYLEQEKVDLKDKLDTGVIDKDTYDDEVYIIDLKAKYEIGKIYNVNDNWKISTLEEIKILKSNIRSGVDTLTQKVLTEKGLKEAKDNIKLNEYRLEHNYPPFVSGTSSIGSARKTYDYIVSNFTMLVLAIMIIIIAGSSISTEISKGTIKFWSFTPNKRWKILLSKLFVDTIILLITTICITLLSTVVGNVFFGSQNTQPYIYVSGESVHTISYVLFAILYNLVIGIDIFMFLLLAMMLSTVARNTAVSVGISIAAYLGGSTVTQIINLFVKSDWIKFVPFNNLSLQDKIFSNDISYMASAMTYEMLSNTSVEFSLAVLGVCAIIMIITMFDSFRKRDIG